MAIRVGLDLVAVADVERALAEHGEHYLRRIFTPAEVASCTSDDQVDPQRLAARFAAKEAVFKVLQDSVPWPLVEVVRDPDGSVGLELSGPARERAAAEGFTSLSLSLTHEAGFAAAVVVAELAPPVSQSVSQSVLEPPRASVHT